MHVIKQIVCFNCELWVDVHANELIVLVANINGRGMYMINNLIISGVNIDSALMYMIKQWLL